MDRRVLLTDTIECHGFKGARVMKISTKRVVLSIVVAFAAGTAFGQGQVVVELAGGDGVAYSGTAAPAATDAGRTEYASLADATTYDLFVDTPDDILLVDFQLEGAGTVWNDDIAENPYGKLGSDVKAPNPATFANWPALAADSWVRTPGATAAADNTPFLGPEMVTYFDTDVNGAQQRFNFARITLHSNFKKCANFKGSIQVADPAGPIIQPFRFSMGCVPEPGTMGLLLSTLLGGIAIFRKRR